jgi:hypothetical protein
MAKSFCETMRRGFLKTGALHKRARGKRRTFFEKRADTIETNALKAKCEWADRINGWDIDPK